MENHLAFVCKFTATFHDLKKPTICFISLSSSPHNRQALTTSSVTFVRFLTKVRNAPSLPCDFHDLKKPTIRFISLSSSPHNRHAFTMSSVTLPATSDLLIVFSHPQYLTSTRSPFRSIGLFTMYEISACISQIRL